MPGVSAINAHICACISVGKPGYGIVVTSMGRRVALPLTRMLPLLRVTCTPDRKSTRLNSSHVSISYAAFCLKKIKELNLCAVGQRLPYYLVCRSIPESARNLAGKFADLHSHHLPHRTIVLMTLVYNADRDSI